MKAGQPMIQWVEINRKAFLHNVGEFKRRLGRTELMAVVKANAYGHGLLEIASLARGSWPELAGGQQRGGRPGR